MENFLNTGTGSRKNQTNGTSDIQQEEDAGA